MVEPRTNEEESGCLFRAFVVETDILFICLLPLLSNKFIVRFSAISQSTLRQLSSPC